MRCKSLLTLIVGAFACSALSASAQSLQFRVLSETSEPIHSAIISAGEPTDRMVMTEAEMDQIDREFSPYVLSVQEGQKVSFPNKDDVRHHVYSFSEAKTFEMRLYSGRPEAPLTFDKSGVVVLGCNIHDNMVGFVYVTKRPYKGRSNTAGEVRLNTTSEISKVTVWHPDLSLDSLEERDFALADLETVNEDDQTIYLVPLDIPTPRENPQAREETNDRFSRFKFE